MHCGGLPVHLINHLVVIYGDREGARANGSDGPRVSASVGPAEFDVAAFVQSIEAEGGPRADASLAWYESALPLRRDVLIGSVAGIAGYFADRAPRPAPPGLPRLRSVQRRQLKASLGWAARVLEVPEPAWLAAVPS
jgi:hypothetical protein